MPPKKWRKPMCKNGHPQDDTTRDRNGMCCQCRRKDHGYTSRTRCKLFCVRGHRQHATSRSTNGGCKKCEVVRKREQRRGPRQEPPTTAGLPRR